MMDNLSAFLTYFLCTSFKLCLCTHSYKNIHKLSSELIFFFPHSPPFSPLFSSPSYSVIFCCMDSRGDINIPEIQYGLGR